MHQSRCKDKPGKVKKDLTMDVDAVLSKKYPKEQQRKFGRETRVWAATQIDKEDWYRVISGITLLAEALQGRKAAMLRERGTEIMELANRMDLLWCKTVGSLTHGEELPERFVLQLVTEEWKDENTSLAG
jgi:queuine/archaeosine tRNA-ribosyltransferase